MLNTLDINDAAAFGLIRDQASHIIPPEAWDTALNVRYRDGSVERLLGWAQLFGTPLVAPHFAMPLVTAATSFWLYTSLTKAYLWNGASHINITRPDGTGEDQVAGGDGTNIGDLTGGGGLAAANDGTTAQANAACATKASATTSFTGKTLAAAIPVTKAVVYGSNDAGFVVGDNPTMTLTLYGKNGAAPADDEDGTVLGTATFTDTTDESSGRTVTSADLTTEYLHRWVKVAHNGSAATIAVAESEFFNRADDDYTTTLTRDWNGTIIGGIPILNNGVDIPQMWTPPVSSTKLANLTNWVSTARAKVLRSLGPFLIAYNLTDSGTNKPHLVRWAHPADPGSVPSSWDVTDATKDTGEVDLPDVNSGIILDALPLQGVMYVYKEGSIWRQTLVGGQSIFDFKTFTETAGILAPRCVTVTGDGLNHVVVTQDDIIIHNGNKAESMLQGKIKKELFGNIDISNYKNSFLFTNPVYDEVWFCYPSTGATNPDSALIINYRTGEVGALSEANGVTFRNASIGPIEDAEEEPWDDDSDSWDSDVSSWGTVERRRVVLCVTDDSKFCKLDEGADRDGTEYIALLQRTGLALVGRKRNGDWIVDFETRKVVTRIWPKVRRGSLRCRVGFQDLVDGPVTWKGYFVFNPEDGSLSPAAGVTSDFTGSGRAMALEFTDTTTPTETWSVDGYKVELALAGKF